MEYISILSLFLSILTFYIATTIEYKLLRICLGVMLSIFISVSITFAIAYGVLEYVLALFILVILVELIELKVIVNHKIKKL